MNPQENPDQGPNQNIPMQDMSSVPPQNIQPGASPYPVMYYPNAQMPPNAQFQPYMGYPPQMPQQGFAPSPYFVGQQIPVQGYPVQPQAAIQEDSPFPPLYTVNTGGWLSEAWGIFKIHYRKYMAHAFLWICIYFLISLAFSPFRKSDADDANTDSTNDGSDTSGDPSSDTNGSDSGNNSRGNNLADTLFNLLVSAVIIPAAQIGMYHVSFLHMRSQLPSFRDFFYPLRNAKLIGALFAAHFISHVATTIGLLLFLIPGLYLAIAFNFTTPLILEHPELGIIGALKASMTQQNKQLCSLICFYLALIGCLFVPMFFLNILLAVFAATSSLGGVIMAILIGVVALVTVLPYISIAESCAFRDIFGLSGVLMNAPGQQDVEFQGGQPLEA